MSTTINEGFLNEIVVQAESSFAGSVTGTARRLVGQTGFQYQPKLIRGQNAINVWREMDGDSFAGRYFEGTITMDYRHGELMALLLSSLLQRSGTSPNYSFSNSHRSNRQSLAFGLSYEPNDVHFVFRGTIITGAMFTIRARELVQVRFDFKSAQLTDDGPLTSPVTETSVGASGLESSIEYDSVSMARAYDASFQIMNDVDFVNYNRSKAPTRAIPSGQFTISNDLAEWMSDDATEGDAIAANVRNQTETDLEVAIVPASGKLFRLNVPRGTTRSGTPVGIDRAGIGYRAGIEAQTGEDRTDKPVLTMTL